MATEAILVVCRRCSSPFLQPCTAAGVARCRSCGWIHFLGAREVAADSFPVDPVTRIVVRDDLPPGTVLVTRYTPRLVCERLAQARDAEAVV